MGEVGIKDGMELGEAQILRSGAYGAKEVTRLIFLFG